MYRTARAARGPDTRTAVARTAYTRARDRNSSLSCILLMSQYTRACHMPCQWLNCPVATHSRRHCERAESRTRIDELPEHCPSPSAFRTHATWRLRCGRCHTHSKRKRSMCGGESAHHEHELPRPTRHRRVAASADTVGGGRQVVNMWLAATDLRCIPASALPCCLQQPTPPHPSPPPSPSPCALHSRDLMQSACRA